MSIVVTDLHRSSIHCIVLQGRRNNLYSRNSSWDHTYRTVWACTCLQHLHILPHCNCLQYPQSTEWWLPPQMRISTVTLFQPEANKQLRKLLHSAAQSAQNGLHSVKWDMMEWLHCSTKFNFFFGTRGKISNPNRTFNAEFKCVSSFSPPPTVCSWEPS